MAACNVTRAFYYLGCTNIPSATGQSDALVILLVRALRMIHGVLAAYLMVKVTLATTVWRLQIRDSLSLPVCEGPLATERIPYVRRDDTPS